MLKYIIIPLANNSVSICHYTTCSKNGGFIDAVILKKAIRWSMKQNATPQFVFPSTPIPPTIKELINEIDHVTIVPANVADKSLRENADVVVFDNWDEVESYEYQPKQSYLVRASFHDMLANSSQLKTLLSRTDRINVVITDIEIITDTYLSSYRNFLESLIPVIVEEYKNNHYVQLNLLTDRLMFGEMNNCNAGYENITLSPDGKWYVCPAFIGMGNEDIGSLETGLNIKNPQLYTLSCAPICSACDAWQCKRCVWLNKKLTREINTPGHQQCIVAHIERNASQKLLHELRGIKPLLFNDVDIPEIDYLDPFDKIAKK